jgi:hypothetical protein
MKLVKIILRRIVRKCLFYRHLLEKHNAENLQDFAKTLLDSQFFLDNGCQQVHADCNPYLDLDGIYAGAEKRLYAKIMLYPFEKEFHFPSAFEKLRNRQCW